MNEKRKTLSDSELQHLREAIDENEKRKWLCRLIRTGAAWAAATVITAAATIDAAKRIFDGVTGK
jgi:hypothetical protein